MGRPPYKLPKNFNDVVSLYLNKELSNQEACTKLNMRQSTFFKYVNIYKNNPKEKVMH